MMSDKLVEQVAEELRAVMSTSRTLYINTEANVEAKARSLIALITEAGAQAIENKLNYYNDVEPNYRVDKIAYLGAKEEAIEAIRKLGKVE